ncbi:hypothetical protein [Leisingera sp. JC1]|uniref:hypothetical protein n=1 Tax=Leisingera sp. JC1 TaxID=1855282 RepID=UPI0008030EB4|nr:hypothetical protein [Leisingera sp. JC1]OBY27850.1 hypothetical protein A9D60_13925 [Leisingera sp. JC1]
MPFKKTDIFYSGQSYKAELQKNSKRPDATPVDLCLRVRETRKASLFRQTGPCGERSGADQAV